MPRDRPAPADVSVLPSGYVIVSCPARSAAVGTASTWVVPEHLPETLILAKVEGSTATVVEMRQQHRSTIRESKLISAKGWILSRVRNGWMVEIVSRIERRVAQEFKKRAVKAAAAGTRDDVGEAGCAASNLRRHPSGT